jgi:hypothetical protein
VCYQGPKPYDAVIVLPDLIEAGKAGDIHEDVHTSPHTSLKLKHQVCGAGDNANSLALFTEQPQNVIGGIRLDVFSPHSLVRPRNAGHVARLRFMLCIARVRGLESRSLLIPSDYFAGPVKVSERRL